MILSNPLSVGDIHSLIPKGEFVRISREAIRFLGEIPGSELAHRLGCTQAIANYMRAKTIRDLKFDLAMLPSRPEMIRGVTLAHDGSYTVIGSVVDSISKSLDLLESRMRILSGVGIISVHQAAGDSVVSFANGPKLKLSDLADGTGSGHQSNDIVLLLDSTGSMSLIAKGLARMAQEDERLNDFVIHLIGVSDISSPYTAKFFGSYDMSSVNGRKGFREALTSGGFSTFGGPPEESYGVGFDFASKYIEDRNLGGCRVVFIFDSYPREHDWLESFSRLLIVSGGVFPMFFGFASEKAQEFIKELRSRVEITGLLSTSELGDKFHSVISSEGVWHRAAIKIRPATYGQLMPLYPSQDGYHGLFMYDHTLYASSVEPGIGMYLSPHPGPIADDLVEYIDQRTLSEVLL